MIALGSDHAGFAMKEKMKAVEIYGMTNVGSNSFYEYEQLTTVIFHETIETFGDYAFHSCNTLVSG